MHHNRTTQFSTKIQNSNDIIFLQQLLSAGNGRARRLAEVRIREIQKPLAKVIAAPIPVIKELAPTKATLDADAIKAKRSAAAKKAAATRAAKKKVSLEI